MLTKTPENDPTSNTTRAALLKDDRSGRYVWAAVYFDSCGGLEIIDIVPNMDAAKSAAWAYAQRHGAVFVPARRRS